MFANFMDTVRARSDQAIASGDLQPIVAEQTILHDRDLPFVVRWVAALAAKDAAQPSAQQSPDAPGPAATVLPGGPRDPDFNPFLHPDPALTVGPVGADHVAILNKFPVCLHHLVLARRHFAEQLSPLELTDFHALALLLSGQGGLGFYNGGAAAGASQRHKHVQWIPAAPENASLQALTRGLPAVSGQGAILRHPLLASLAHCLIRVDAGPGAHPEDSAASLLTAFGQGCADLGLRPDAQGLLPPFNLLAGDGWMLMVPRSQEHFLGISLNALSFGGTIYVRDPAQMDAIRRAGPLNALFSVGLSPENAG
ncbi:phosphorylase [Castellaniella hirudinis]|uniref:phosphorylase n=1 Tax=Castellaniella hirudinis TaxID=1144617 RepID=UPI0039C3DEE5